ncbi:PREDICTED: LOW QUALITY PROTEIN: amiloride-sensitive sodium channel subunit delta [Lipotes vexillifer]|uniref:LOW QUALITY PROTEIN: amiloride-sensitive sodium channel subunit delta n=1 Tax=Lipotes vexillifer TaxID=118797 RepID=A0A340WPX2_LIPVE|nr:PREDICTED: LOW QUALITY PROTEIN: amiloride-sensitive sodium channel subunit delta [Lipotes vexillifer]
MAPGEDTWVGSDRTVGWDPTEARFWDSAGAMAQAAGGGPGTRTCPQLPPSPPPPPPEEGRGERLVELRASLRELVATFCTNGTIHGAIRLVCSSQNRLKTASWGLRLARALGVLCWQLGLLFGQYRCYPVIMTVSVHSEAAQRKLFLSVTLCDMNLHWPHPARRPLRALDNFARENIYSLCGFNFSNSEDAPGAECNSAGGDCIQQAYSSSVVAAWEWYRLHRVNVLALLPAAHEDGHHSRGRHFVFSCPYNGQGHQARHFQTSHHPSYGSCYTFNSVWAARHPGITHAVLALGMKQQDHLLLPTGAGIKVVIHTPFLEHRKSFLTYADKVHRLGSPCGHCTTARGGVDVQLLYTVSCTRQACLVSCFQPLMVETRSCGCCFKPWPAGAEDCNSVRHPAWGSPTTPSPSHCFHCLCKDLETHRLPCASRCPRPCRGPSCKLSTGTSSWPSSKSAVSPGSRVRPHGQRALPGLTCVPKALPSHCPAAPGEEPQPQSNLAKVNTFSQELNYCTHPRVPQLLSATGSLWSLWFGSCVLSVVEMLELLLDAAALALLLCCRQLRGARGQPRAATGVPAPSQRPAGGRVAAGMTSNARGPSSTSHDVAGAPAGVLAGGHPGVDPGNS